jgi:lysozyme
MNKKTNKAGIDLLKRFEGFSSAAYKCPAGIPTIGFGFTKGVKMGDSITPENAEIRLKAELLEYERCVNETVFRDLTDNQFAALVCLCYNIGCRNFKDSSLVKNLNLGMNLFDCSIGFLKWNKIRVNGNLVESNGLKNRRTAERELFLK